MNAIQNGAVVCAVSPDGRRFRLRFDGYQDFSLVAGGVQEQLTALEEIPGLVVLGSTTYSGTIRKRGFRISHDRYDR